MDVEEVILEFFEENDWDMSIDSIEICADKVKKEFGSEEEAVEYIHGYLTSLFG
jgi:hypothetical protein